MINMIDHLMKRFWNNRIPIKHAVHVCSFLISTFEGIGLKELEDGEEPKFVIYLRSDNGVWFGHGKRDVNVLISGFLLLIVTVIKR